MTGAVIAATSCTRQTLTRIRFTSVIARVVSPFRVHHLDGLSQFRLRTFNSCQGSQRSTRNDLTAAALAIRPFVLNVPRRCTQPAFLTNRSSIICASVRLGNATNSHQRPKSGADRLNIGLPFVKGLRSSIPNDGWAGIIGQGLFGTCRFPLVVSQRPQRVEAERQLPGPRHGHWLKPRPSHMCCGFNRSPQHMRQSRVMLRP